jgi:hypothetical protein
MLLLGCFAFLPFNIVLLPAVLTHTPACRPLLRACAGLINTSLPIFPLLPRVLHTLGRQYGLETERGRNLACRMTRLEELGHEAIAKRLRTRPLRARI